jgi:hypothetical protein
MGQNYNYVVKDCDGVASKGDDSKQIPLYFDLDISLTL